MKNKEIKKKSKIEKLEELITEEKSKDQEELIDFYYKSTNGKMLIHDKRKLRIEMLEMDLCEMKQHNEILRNECPYNPKTDDIIDEQNNIENFEYEETTLEKQLEDAFQELSNKMWEMKENSKKITVFFQKNIQKFEKKQWIMG